MNKIIAITAFVLASVSAVAQQFAISSPTKGQTFYADDTLQIRWSGADRTANSGMVRCYIIDKSGERLFVSRPADNGGVDWAVSKLIDLGLNSTNVTLRIESSTSATVAIVILPGSRPVVVDPPPTVTPKSVPVFIEATISLTFEGIAGHYYIVEAASSVDAQEWTTIDQGILDRGGPLTISYPMNKAMGFIRIFDTTPE